MPRFMTPSLNPAGHGLLAVSLLLLTLAGGVTASELEQQRAHFLEAREALRDGNISRFHSISESLRDYPLYPYLVYDHLRPRLVKAESGEVISYLDNYPGLPMSHFLRRSWLKLLAGRGQWQTFLEHYTLQADVVLQCYQLLARIKSGGDAALLEDIRRLWLVGKSQPKQCDPAFDHLYASDLMSPELLWQRIELAMGNGETQLARWLARRLDAKRRQWLEQWIAIYVDPGGGTRDPGIEDTEVARSMLAHGLMRLARRDIDTAIRHWDSLRARYAFNPAQGQSIQYRLAMYAVIHEHERARQLLNQLDGTAADPESLFHWRLRWVLQSGDWPALIRWTNGTPPADRGLRPRWQYWRARALEREGIADAARNLFRKLAAERDYYSFLAADRLGLEYNFNHLALSNDPEEWETISRLPGIIRARELYRLNMTYQARREWYHLVYELPSREQQTAALIAASWGWHDRAILTLGRAEALDDLELRFPLPYRELMEKYAGKRDLDLSWIYALTRAESAFMEDARSPAGAMGLMQLMPATGHQTAHAIGFQTYHNYYLLQPDKNVTIGTAYLKQMYDRFNGNKILATAAYNAGPHNVSRWLPEVDCSEPDIWIARIPFAETRKYVARVLYYSIIYDWRLGKTVRPIKERMARIGPVRDRLMANLNCAATQVTQN